MSPSLPDGSSFTDGTLWALIERRARETPDEPMAVDESGRRLSFGEYRRAAERAAAGLSALGVAEGVGVSWQLPTWLESLVLVGALSRLGAVQNPVLPIYRDRELRFMTAQTDAGLLVVPPVWRGFDFPAMAHAIAADSKDLDVLVVDRALPEADASALPPPPPVPGSAAGLPTAWVFYTSGTTADPKGARHTDATIAAAAVAMNAALGLVPEDRSALVFPFTHIGGITWLFSSLMTGCANVCVERFDPTETVDVLSREDVTLAGSGTPFHLAYLEAQRQQPGKPIFPLVRAFPGGGAPKPPQLHYDMKAELGGVGIVSGYGLTECPILSMGAVGDPDDKLANTEGRASPGVQLEIVSIDGVPVGTGQEGELRVKGPQLFRGYVDTSLDAEALDEHGFFRTGDLAVVDDGGFVAITGRLKDVIIRKGENISAKEVEDLLYQHPKVADVAVIGLPDPALGERCCAVVATKEGSEPLELAEIVAFLTGQGLAIQKAPEQLELVDVVPRNPTGKTLKHELRQRLSS
jgi:acyl-CoA synthetase (AMP-forming)/AMP-acid ligase II